MHDYAALRAPPSWRAQHGVRIYERTMQCELLSKNGMGQEQSLQEQSGLRAEGLCLISIALRTVDSSRGSTITRQLARRAIGRWRLARLDEAQLPLLVLTERQTAGRGRGANRWWSADGALTFSLVLEAPTERLPPTRWPQIALVAGVAVCEALQSLAQRAELRVKWPNDVYLADGKICGILCESIPGSRDRLVVGIGVNVNNRVPQGPMPNVQSPKSEVAAELGSWTLDFGLHSAASLVEHDGVARDLTEVLVTVLDELDRRWRELLEGRFNEAATVYRERCLLTGKIVRIAQAGDSTVVGLCRGIDDSGRLRVQTERGEIAVVSGSVVSWDE